MWPFKKRATVVQSRSDDLILNDPSFAENIGELLYTVAIDYEVSTIRTRLQQLSKPELQRLERLLEEIEDRVMEMNDLLSKETASGPYR